MKLRFLDFTVFCSCTISVGDFNARPGGSSWDSRLGRQSRDGRWAAFRGLFRLCMRQVNHDLVQDQFFLVAENCINDEQYFSQKWWTHGLKRTPKKLTTGTPFLWAICTDGFPFPRGLFEVLAVRFLGCSLLYKVGPCQFASNGYNSTYLGFARCHTKTIPMYMAICRGEIAPVTYLCWAISNGPHKKTPCFAPIGW